MSRPWEAPWRVIGHIMASESGPAKKSPLASTGHGTGALMGEVVGTLARKRRLRRLIERLRAAQKGVTHA